MQALDFIETDLNAIWIYWNLDFLFLSHNLNTIVSKQYCTYPQSVRNQPKFYYEWANYALVYALCSLYSEAHALHNLFLARIMISLSRLIYLHNWEGIENFWRFDMRYVPTLFISDHEYLTCHLSAVGAFFPLV